MTVHDVPESEISSLIDLYDTEILEIERVSIALNAKQGTVQPLESFRKEIIERMAEIGLVVRVTVYTNNGVGDNEIFSFIATIVGRTEDITWDPDRQVHEVRTDILDLLPNSEKGQWIKTDGLGPVEDAPKHSH